MAHSALTPMLLEALRLVVSDGDVSVLGEEKGRKSVKSNSSCSLLKRGGGKRSPAGPHSVCILFLLHAHTHSRFQIPRSCHRYAQLVPLGSLKIRPVAQYFLISH